MKKPTQEIERMRALFKAGRLWDDSVRVALAYLDSLKEWPADLTRERLEELADYASRSGEVGSSNYADALRRLAAIAPKREKRKVEIWQHVSGQKLWKYPDDGWHLDTRVWTKRGEAEIDA